MKVSIIIRFTNSISSENIPDLSIPLTINDKDDTNKFTNISYYKSIIREKVSPNKRLRLIYNGRVLNEQTNFIKEVIKNQEIVYIHCVVGEELTEEQLEQENQLDIPQQQSTTEIIGFDRLLQQGFSQDDVMDLRRQFNLIYGESSQQPQDIDDVEENEARQRELRQMEERWIESTNNNEEIEQESASIQVEDETHVNEDLLLGFLIGIFLGVVAVVFLLADDTVFNKRQKMSIIAGLFINFSLAIVRGQWI
ncbi:unnamed protein product [Candida verbasci]|uniref:Ubiquitin-like domain-containing protein n=1 Tax=Candida verbasci TaxID=1227364 RepID=A0A9W4TP25_9ASCO|nr:unnamed protein product [Candida verbasci]